MSHPCERSGVLPLSTRGLLCAPTLCSSPTAEAVEVAYSTTKRGLSLYYFLQVVGTRWVGGGGCLTVILLHRASVHVRTYTLCTASLAPGPRVLTHAPARPRLIYDPRVCFQGSANKDDLHQRNSRPAGWLAGRRRPDYWECARPPTEGHFENLEMTTDRETGSRYYFVNRIYLDCISILVSRSADEFLANVSSAFFS